MSLVGRLRGSPKVTLTVVTVALFTDSFLYGLVIPLTPNSPARIEDECAGRDVWRLRRRALPHHADLSRPVRPSQPPAAHDLRRAPASGVDATARVRHY